MTLPPDRLPSPMLLGLGTATPPSLAQARIVELAMQRCSQSDKERAWVRRIFEHSGVEQRGSVLLGAEPIESFYRVPVDANDRGPTTGERLARYAQLAPPLALHAAQAALDDAGLAPERITHLLPVSCTGFFAPGLDAALIEGLRLPPTVRRIQVGFMGCHGAFNSLTAARALCQSDPSARVLICCVELCTLHFAYGFDPQRIVANALFADGAAAAVVGLADDPPRRPRLDDTASLIVPHSADAMTWTIGDHGFVMTLSPKLPDLIRGSLRPFLSEWLGQHGLGIADIAHWAVHPGGPKVLSAVEETLELPPHCLDASRQVLAQHGNLSSATVLFILQRLRPQAGPCVALGFGPGLSVESMLLACGSPRCTI